MKSLFAYHGVTLPPIIIIVYLFSYGYIDTLWFVLLMLIYGLIFRPIFDFYRLKALNLINDYDFWRIFGSIRFRHYGDLMFGKRRNSQ